MNDFQDRKSNSNVRRRKSQPKWQTIEKWHEKSIDRKINKNDRFV